MGALVEIGGIILSQAEGRAEIAAQNISNITTPGYKRRVSFENVIASTDPVSFQNTALSLTTDFSPGKPMETGDPYNLAISGKGFFVVRSGDGLVYTRQGQFRRDADGRVVTADGLALQTEDGADFVLKSDAFEVASDGVVTENGAPIAKLALMDIADASQARAVAGGFSASDEAVAKARGASIRQGALESSNVSTADEMIAVMQAVRQAETGQRIIGAYDDLMGRALSVFGQN
jgi:flagellar basal-body rod protein FlgG